MSGFFLLAASMCAVALGLVLPRLVRGCPPQNVQSRRAANARIHAAELDALAGDLAAGHITPGAHDAARDEVLRRVLEEGGADAASAPSATARMPAAVVSVAVPLVAFLLYVTVGNPGALNIAGGAAASDSPSITASTLERHVKYAPRDGRAWVMLARRYMEASRYEEAARGYEQAIAAATQIANDPEVWCELADALGMAQGGVLHGRPRELIGKALAIRPSHPRALEMAGSAAYEAGEHGRALQYWSDLLAQLPTASAEHRELAAAIASVRFRMAATQSH